MTHGSGHIRNTRHPRNYNLPADLRCNWHILREQLLAQWSQLSATDLDMTGPDAGRIAQLIERKYGISAQMIENYLQNFVRTMPLQ